MIHPRPGDDARRRHDRLPARAGRGDRVPAAGGRASFNAISVDGECSTNDCRDPARERRERHRAHAGDRRGVRALRSREVCAELAQQIVADGEGMTVLAEIAVARRGDDARGARDRASAIATSPLVKTALFGHDANWGRDRCWRPARRRSTAATRSSIPTGSRSRSTASRCSSTARRPATSRVLDERPSCTIELDLGLGTGARELPDERPLLRLRAHQRGLPDMSTIVVKVGGASPAGVARGGRRAARDRRTRSASCTAPGRRSRDEMERARARAVEFVGGRRVTTTDGLEVVRESSRRGQRGALRGDRRAMRSASSATRSASRREQVPELGLVGEAAAVALRARSLAALAAGPHPGRLAARARAAQRERRRGRRRARGRASAPTRIRFLTDVPGVYPRRRARRARSAPAAPSRSSTAAPSRAGSSRSCSPRPARRRSGLDRGDRRDGGGRMSTMLDERRSCRRIRATRVTFVDGDGIWLIDDVGRRYLDFAAGIAVVGLGHRHPAPLAAAHAQLDRLWHVVEPLRRPSPLPALARRLSRALRRRAGVLLQLRRRGDRGGDQVRAQGDRQARRASRSSRASTAARRARSSVTGQPAKRAAFEPLLPGARFAHAERRRLAARRGRPTTSASILLEPVLGEGGVIPLDAGVPRRRRRRSRTSSARCSPSTRCRPGSAAPAAFFAFEQLGVRPQLVTLAKALANGLPIGCLLVADDAAGAFAPGDHGSTFGGNPVVCAAAARGRATRSTTRCSQQVRANGARLLAGLGALPRRRRGARRRPARRRRARPAGAAVRRRGARCRPRRA